MPGLGIQIVIYLVGVLVTSLVYGLYLKNLCGLKKNFYLMPVIWLVVDIMFKLFWEQQENVVLNVIACLGALLLTAFVCAEGSYKKKLVLAVLYFMVIILEEPLEVILVVELGIGSPYDIKENFYVAYVSFFLMQFALFLFVQLVSFLFAKKLHNATGSRYGIGVLMISIGCFGVNFIQLVNMMKHNDYTWPNLLSVMMLMGIVFMSYYFFQIGEEKNRLEMEYKSYEDQLKVYNQWIEEQKQSRNAMESLRHDMKNHIYALKVMCNKAMQDGQGNLVEDIDEYLCSIGTNYNIVKNEVNSGNVLLDAILNMKINYATSKGIAADADVTVPKDWQYDCLDMVIILGNLLDNAIEACEQLYEEKDRKLHIELRYDKGNLFLFLENTYSGGIDGTDGFSRKNQFPKTTKKEKQMHGIGMKNIAKVVNKYDGVMHWKAEHEMFYTEVLLYGIPEG